MSLVLDVWHVKDAHARSSPTKSQCTNQSTQGWFTTPIST